MTTDAAGAVSMMGADEVNAAVAVHVMGWKLETQRDDIEGARDPEGHYHVWSSGMEMFNNFWSPATQPATDYSVLVKVRETWDQDALDRFGNELYDLWEGRVCNEWYKFLAAKYAPGDYSRAALSALAPKP